MTTPLSLRDLAAHFIAEADNVEELNLPQELYDYVHSMQGASLNQAYAAVENFNALLIALRDRNEELVDLDVVTQFLLSAQELQPVVDNALAELASDLDTVLTMGSQEWQEYAVPLLTETQESLMTVQRRLAGVVQGLEMGLEEINNPTM